MGGAPKNDGGVAHHDRRIELDGSGKGRHRPGVRLAIESGRAMRDSEFKEQSVGVRAEPASLIHIGIQVRLEPGLSRDEDRGQTPLTRDVAFK